MLELFSNGDSRTVYDDMPNVLGLVSLVYLAPELHLTEYSFLSWGCFQKYKSIIDCFIHLHKFYVIGAL